MKRLAPLIVLLAFVAAPALAADGPTPYPDPKDQAAWPGQGPIRVHPWMKDNRAFFWTQREKAQGSVVFVGDSLTGGWKADAMSKAFPKMKVANRGVGGDTSRGILFRFQEDVLDLKPSAIVILAGGNDLSAHGPPAAIEANIAAMIEQARKQNPAVPIVLCTLPPRDNPKAPTKPNALQDTNARIVKLAEGKENIALVDLHKAVSDAEGNVVPENFAADKLHLAGPGYDKWAEILKPAFEKLGIQ
jgi:lysophospholipase L1-like esterase